MSNTIKTHYNVLVTNPKAKRTTLLWTVDGLTKGADERIADLLNTGEIKDFILNTADELIPVCQEELQLLLDAHKEQARQIEVLLDYVGPVESDAA